MKSCIFCIFKVRRCLAWMQLLAAVRTGVLSLPPADHRERGGTKGRRGSRKLT